MKKLFLVGSIAVLAGCGSSGGGSGGGGGAGGGSGIPTVAFTSWSDLRPNSEIVAPAISTELAYTENDFGTVTSTGPLESYAGVEFRETFGPDGTVTKASVTTGDGDRLVFDSAQGASFAPIANGTATAALSADQSEIAIAVEPLVQGWNYQTFGVWQRSPAETRVGRAGAISTGNFTAANNVPSIGTATFTGAAAGIYQPADGSASGLVSAQMALAVDFSDRVAGFATAGSAISFDGGQTFSASPALDLTGSLQVANNQNAMAGTVRTQSPRMSGDINGKFYGPNAQEVGGTFGLKGSGVETYIGGFGGKR